MDGGFGWYPMPEGIGSDMEWWLWYGEENELKDMVAFILTGPSVEER